MIADLSKNEIMLFMLSLMWTWRKFVFFFLKKGHLDSILYLPFEI